MINNKIITQQVLVVILALLHDTAHNDVLGPQQIHVDIEDVQPVNLILLPKVI